MNDDPEANRAPPAPRNQRAASGLSTELQLCCAKLRAEGFDVVRADVLLGQDRELERFRNVEAAGGFRVAVADVEDRVGRLRHLTGVLVVYLVRVSHELGDRRTAERLLEDLDAELAALGLRRPSERDPTLELATDPELLLTHGAKLRRLEELERRVAELDR